MVVILALVACRSETGLRNLEVTTQVEIKLPPDAIYGNISAFSGFHAAVPDLFIDEKIEETDGVLIRTLRLSHQTVIVDELIESNDENRLINYKTRHTSLPVEEMSHTIRVIKLSDQNCKVMWTSNILVQNQNRDHIAERITGIQESYLFSLELLGEELDELLKDSDF